MGKNSLGLLICQRLFKDSVQLGSHLVTEGCYTTVVTFPSLKKKAVKTLKNNKSLV